MEQGSHEFLVFQAIPPEGLPQSEIKVQGCMWSWNIKDDLFYKIMTFYFWWSLFMHLLIPANMLPWLRSEVMRKSEKLGESVVQNQQDCNNVLKCTNFLKTFPCTFNTNLRTLTWDNCSYTSYWSWNWHFYMVRQAIIMERSSTGSVFSTVILRPWVLLWFGELKPELPAQ